MIRGFRKLSVRERSATISDRAHLSEEERTALFSEATMDLADVMVESAFGTFPLPLGLLAEVFIDGEAYSVPMATEEPSVIAAASFAARLITRNGGFATEVTDPIMTTQLLIEDPAPEAERRLAERQEEIVTALHPVLASMEKRGGGFRGIETRRLDGTGSDSVGSSLPAGADLSGAPLMVVEIHVDVCNAMGANVLNTAAETVRGLVAEITGGTAVMAILTNAGRRRLVRTSFRVPVSQLSRGGFDGPEVARRLEQAIRFADLDENRAVTHNKGLMNGVTAVTLATGNDTRAVEAAAHAYASRDGRYRSLSRFRREGDSFVGSLELPLALGTVGGAVGFHPGAQAALRILGNPGADALGRIAASVGLAQNLAAMWALVTEGIQLGHMRLHSRRIAWKAGARGSDIESVASVLQNEGVFNIERARQLLQRAHGEAAGADDEE